MKKTITLVQKDAHWGFVKEKWAAQIIWDVLSYSKVIRIKDWKRPKGYRIEEITASFLDKRGTKFPFGLVDYISDKLINDGYEVEIQELNFKELKIINPSIPDITFEDYQIKILEKVKQTNRGIIQAVTGSGKTLSAAGIISLYDYPMSLFTTINKTILNQTYEDFCKWFPDIEIGKIGDGHNEVGHITVALYQSLSKWDLSKYNKELELIMLDETHKAVNSLSKIMRQFTNVNYRYGLTATVQKEEKDAEKFFQMIGNVGDVIVEVGDDECSARVTDVDVYMIKNINTEPAGISYQDIFRKDILLNNRRNKKILKAVNDLLLSKGKTALVMVDEISHARQLFYIAMEMGLNPRIAHGKNDSETNEDIKNLLNTKEINLVIATGILSTGTNIPTLDGVALCSIRKSEIQLMQTIGRSRRRVGGKDKAIVIDVYDTIVGEKKFHKHFKQYSKDRKELYEEKGWFKGFIK